MTTSPQAKAETARSFELFGSRVRILVGVPRAPGSAPAPLVALELERSLRAMHERLTRFEPASELCALNRDPRREVPASPFVTSFLGAAAEAAELTGGLADATVIDGVEASGYETSFSGRRPTPLGRALALAPARKAARPRSPSAWMGVRIDGGRGLVSRPPGVRFDSGGIAKGLAADRCARALAGHSSFAVDCGGDVRIGGADGLERTVEILDPFAGEPVGDFGLAAGAVATSGLRRRVWMHRGDPAHHLIDPSTGRPAWTGLVQATAVAPTAVEAEARAKAALLSGPSGAGAWLERWGGVAFTDGGEPLVFGDLPARLHARTAAA